MHIDKERRTKQLDKHQENENTDCIWDCEECDENLCEGYYYLDMEFDESKRKEEFIKEWFEYIEDRGE